MAELRPTSRIFNADTYKTVHAWIGGAITLSGMISGWFTAYVVYVTVPVAGLTFHHSDQPPNSKLADDGITICQYEIFNPGPGIVKDVALVIRVDEKYNKVNEDFEGNLVVTAMPSSQLATKINGHQSEITVTPIEQNNCIQLNDGSRCGIILQKKAAKWGPSSVNMRFDGDERPAMAIMPKASTRNRALIVLGIGPFLLFLAGIGYWLLVRKLRSQAMAWAANECDRRKQEFLAEAYAENMQTLEKTAVPDAKSAEPFTQAIENRKLIILPHD